MVVDVYVNNIFYGFFVFVVLIMLFIIFFDLVLFIVVGIDFNYGKISLMYIYVILFL